MTDFDELDLERTEHSTTGGPGGRSPGPLLAAAIGLVALVAGVGYLAFRKAPAPSPSPPPAAVAPTPVPSAPVTPLTGPPIDESDALVRELARGLSSHPQLVVWLAARGLVRTFTVAVENVASGQTPRAHLAFLAPKDAFAVVQKQGRIFVDPRSYARYDGLVDGFASLDTAGCARVYRQLDPLFERAYRNLGYPEGGFKGVFARAVAMLEAVPVVDGDVEVKSVLRSGIVYEHADRRVEALAPAQKQLLRLGPRNARKVQAKLRELAEALELRASPQPSPES
jgi:hypothetical protein